MTACLDITLFKKVDIYIFIYICVSEIACNIVLQHGDKDNVGKRKKIQTLHRKFHILNLDSGRTATARVNPTSCGAPSCHLKNQRHAREPTAEPDRWFGSQGSKSEHLGGRGGDTHQGPAHILGTSVYQCLPLSPKAKAMCSGPQRAVLQVVSNISPSRPFHSLVSRSFAFYLFYFAIFPPEQQSM